MEKIDLKDRKILYHLDIDSRQSFSQIGKKVGLHKDVVAHRVKKLQEKEIIKNFYTVVDTSKFGNHAIRFYFSFQNVTPKIKKEIIDYFIRNKATFTVHSSEGNFDLTVFIYVKTLTEVYSFWNETLNKYRNYFLKKVLSIYYQDFYYGSSFLLSDQENIRIDRKTAQFGCDREKILEIDDLDNQILNLIVQDARIPTIDIAEKLNITATTVRNRIENLKKMGVIKGFRVKIDGPKIGYYWYKVDIELKQADKLNEMIKYIEANPNLLYIFKTIGYVDLELCLVLNNTLQLHQIIEDLSTKFPDAIKNYTYFVNTKTYIFSY